MPLRTLRFQCRHIFTDGHRCGSPCLTREEFCFYHHTTLGARLQSRPARSLSPAPGSFALPLPEDRASIQLSIGHILCRVAEGTLDLRTAQVLLYGLQIAANLFPRRRESDQEPVRPQFVEEVVDDETLGFLPPAAEYIIPPEARTSNDICDDLLRELRELPDADFSTDPTPAILHNLKASSNPTSTGIPEVHLNSRPKSHPTKTLRPKYQGPTQTCTINQPGSEFFPFRHALANALSDVVDRSMPAQLLHLRLIRYTVQARILGDLAVHGENCGDLLFREHQDLQH